MGYFSEMALNKQEELGLPAEQVSAGNAFEDEETFDELPRQRTRMGRMPVKSRRHPPRPMQPPMRTRKNAVPSMRRLKPSVKQNGKPGRLKRKRPSRSSWSVWPR